MVFPTSRVSCVIFVICVIHAICVSCSSCVSCVICDSCAICVGCVCCVICAICISCVSCVSCVGTLKLKLIYPRELIVSDLLRVFVMHDWKEWMTYSFINNFFSKTMISSWRNRKSTSHTFILHCVKPRDKVFANSLEFCCLYCQL